MKTWIEPRHDAPDLRLKAPRLWSSRRGRTKVAGHLMVVGARTVVFTENTVRRSKSGRGCLTRWRAYVSCFTYGKRCALRNNNRSAGV